MYKVVILNGRPRCGKDTFAEMCQHLMPYQTVQIISTVDFVKDLAYKAGWDGNKDLKSREFLSDLKDVLTKWNDVPYKKCEKKIKWHENLLKEFDKDGITFVMCREPEEIQKFEDRLDAVSVLVRRPSVETEETSNHADERVFDHKYQYTIENSGTLDDLEESAKTFLAILLGPEFKFDRAYTIERSANFKEGALCND